MKRLRLVHVSVQPTFMIDDGETLIPFTPEATAVPASEWPNVVQTFAAGVAQLREQIEGPSSADEAEL